MSNYRISSRAIIIRGNKILLNEFNNGSYYNTPGGGVEANESLREAVRREVLEETGLTVESKELLYVYEYNPKVANNKYGPRGSISYFFKCEVNESKEQTNPSTLDKDPNNDEYKQTGSRWIPIDDLESINLIPKLSKYIRDNLRNNDFRTIYIEEK